MSKFVISSKKNPCPVCGRDKDGDCRIVDGGNRVLCHTHQHEQPDINGFHFGSHSDKAQGTGHWYKLNPDKIAPSIKGRIEHLYDTRKGERWIRVERVAGKDGAKSFYQSYWDGQGWVSASKIDPDLKEKMRAEVPIYRYPEVRRFVDEGHPIIIVEGERAADLLREKGFNATTTIGGCENYKSWGNNYSEDFAKARILICPDMDVAGLKYANALKVDIPAAEEIHCFAESPLWKDLPKKDGLDCVDWFAAGATNEDFQRLISRAVEASKKLSPDASMDEVLDAFDLHIAQFSNQAEVEWEANRFAADQGLFRMKLRGADLLRASQARIDGKGTIEVLDARDILDRNLQGREWLIAANIPLGSTIVLASPGGTGKTTLLYGLAKCISTGKPWGAYRTKKSKVLIIQSDEPECDVQEKLEMSSYYDIDHDRVHFTLDWKFTQTRQLEELIEKNKYGLIVIDSYTACHAGTGIDMISSSAGDSLYKLRDIALRQKCSFIVVHHFNKGNGLRDSTTINDNVSEVWKLYKPEENDTSLGPGGYYLERSKSRSGLMGKCVLRQDWRNYSWIHEGEAMGERKLLSLDDLKVRDWLAAHPGTYEALDVASRYTIMPADRIQRSLESLRKYGFIDSRAFFDEDGDKTRTYSLPADETENKELVEVPW